MSDINNKQTEYKEKFQIISEQAEEDGRAYVKKFLFALLEHHPADIQLYDFAFLSADDMTQEMVDIYVQFLEENTELDWYRLISYINDEYDNPEEYYPVILNCKNENISVQDIHDALSESSTADELRKLIDSEPLEKEEKESMKTSDNSSGIARFMDHLKAENQQLNIRLDSTLKELAEARQEVKTAMEESFANRKNALEFKLELEQLRKNESGLNLAVKLAEGKVQKSKNMLAQLESTIERLREDKRCIADENDLLKKELQEKSITISKLEGEKEEYILSVKQLSSEIEMLKQEKAVFQAERESFPGIEVGDTMEEAFFDTSMVPGEPGWSQEDMEEPVLENVEEESDYSADDLISITDNRDEIDKHTNLFAMLISKYQEKKFKRKTVSEQESMIFAKMMEQKFSRAKLLTIKNVLKENTTLSRFELYKLISRDASDKELTQFCGVTVST